MELDNQVFIVLRRLWRPKTLAVLTRDVGMPMEELVEVVNRMEADGLVTITAQDDDILVERVSLIQG